MKETVNSILPGSLSLQKVQQYLGRRVLLYTVAGDMATACEDGYQRLDDRMVRDTSRLATREKE